MQSFNFGNLVCLDVAWQHFDVAFNCIFILYVSPSSIMTKLKCTNESENYSVEEAPQVKRTFLDHAFIHMLWREKWIYIHMYMIRLPFSVLTAMDNKTDMYIYMQNHIQSIQCRKTIHHFWSFAKVSVLRSSVMLSSVYLTSLASRKIRLL